MNIQSVQSNLCPNFSARTNINAPLELINKEEQAFLKIIGNEVGTDKDTLDFTVSDLHTPPRHPEVKTYTITTHIELKTLTGRINSTSTKDIPYEKNGETIEKNSPFNYIQTVISRYLK